LDLLVIVITQICGQLIDNKGGKHDKIRAHQDNGLNADIFMQSLGSSRVMTIQWRPAALFKLAAGGLIIFVTRLEPSDCVNLIVIR
jgi:hypothetical protein